MRHDAQQPDSREMACAAIRNELGALPHGWQARHGVRLGGMHIDHLVTGPVGVVAITTKFHPRARVATDGRQMQVNGVSVDHLLQARIVTRRLGQQLSACSMDHAPLTPGLVFAGLSECRIVGRPSAAVVTVAGQLVRTLQQLPPLLGGAETALLAQAVEGLTER